MSLKGGPADIRAIDNILHPESLESLFPNQREEGCPEKLLCPPHASIFPLCHSPPLSERSGAVCTL